MNRTDHPAVTWLGTGRMGQAMVERLLDSGVEVWAWNRTPGKLDGLLSRGASRLGTPALSRSPVAFSMVLDDRALDVLWESGDGILSGDHPPDVWVDCSTVSVAASQRAAAAAAARGVSFVCAPVSGNPSVVRAGNLLFAVSGPPAAVAVAEPFFGLIGRGYHIAGTRSEARVVKLCTNLVLAVLIQALAEALVLGHGAGVTRSALMEFINDSAIGSPFTRYKTDALVELELAPAFTPEGQRKDLRLALALGAERDVAMPVSSATELAFTRLIASGLGKNRDFAALLLLAAQDAGIQFVPEARG